MSANECTASLNKLDEPEYNQPTILTTKFVAFLFFIKNKKIYKQLVFVLFVLKATYMATALRTTLPDNVLNMVVFDFKLSFGSFLRILNLEIFLRMLTY